LAKHVLGQVADVPAGGGRRFEVEGRAIAVFHVGSRFYALRDRCPHQGAPLSAGVILGTLTADSPGDYAFDDACAHVKCPWHGWEYDLATGQSWYDPARDRVRAYDVSVEPGRELVEGPYVAETIPISIEDDYLVIEMDGAR
jgi:nitrite reductase/ring-hydroxylating ferredoxin subunit